LEYVFLSEMSIQSVTTVEEYVMVGTQRQQVEVYHREAANKWTLTRYTHEHNVLLASIDLMLPVIEIYADTDVPVLASIFSTD
jgi:Uma2 family endonuclease